VTTAATRHPPAMSTNVVGRPRCLEQREQAQAQRGAGLAARGGEAVARGPDLGREHLGGHHERRGVRAHVHEQVEHREAEEHRPQVLVAIAGILAAASMQLDDPAVTARRTGGEPSGEPPGGRQGRNATSALANDI
jgi:hypothetical protein